jgi:hypothetical protein
VRGARAIRQRVGEHDVVGRRTADDGHARVGRIIREANIKAE